MSLKRYDTWWADDEGFDHPPDDFVEANDGKWCLATEAQAEIDNLLTDKHETEIVVAGIVQERDRALAEVDKLRAALGVISKWVLVGPLMSEQGKQLVEITTIASNALKEDRGPLNPSK